MAKFKLDENLPAEAAAPFANAGHDAATALDQQLGGRPDDERADICRREGRALVTLDLDFADIRNYPPADFQGIIVLRLEHVAKQRVVAAIGRLVPVLSQEPLVGKLWIVDEATIRIRG